MTSSAMADEAQKTTNASDESSSLVLGLSGSAWDAWLIISVALAALTAAAVGLTTAASIVSHKREAEGAERELAVYKLTVDGKVSDAKREGIEAGKTAGDALLRAAQLEKDASLAQERIAELNKETARLSAEAESSRAAIASANARALEAQEALARFKAPRSLIESNKASDNALLSQYAGTEVAIYILGDGPEPNALAAQIKDRLSSAHWDVNSWIWTGAGSGIGVFVMYKVGTEAQVARPADAIASVFLASGIFAKKDIWPGDWDTFGGMLGGPNPPAPTKAPIRIVIGTKPQ